MFFFPPDFIQTFPAVLLLLKQRTRGWGGTYAEKNFNQGTNKKILQKCLFDLTLILLLNKSFDEQLSKTVVDL